MTIVQYVILPDGTIAALQRSMDYGDGVIILLLTAMLFLQVYQTWRRS